MVRTRLEIMKLANTASGAAIAPRARMHTHIVAASSRKIAICQAVATVNNRLLRTSAASERSRNSIAFRIPGSSRPLVPSTRRCVGGSSAMSGLTHLD